MKIAILTSPNQWFIPYAKALADELKCPIFYDHNTIKESQDYKNLTSDSAKIDILFILSYHRILPANFLKYAHHNIVVHASNLPQYRGFAPLFWQVIEGKNDIVFSLFEADAKCDEGDIYMQQTLHLNGTELHDELRAKQAAHTIKMCLDFVKIYPHITPTPQQKGGHTCPRRTPKDSELDINRPLIKQFNLLRTTSNEDFPAFFYINGRKFILKIYPDSGGGGVNGGQVKTGGGQAKIDGGQAKTDS